MMLGELTVLGLVVFGAVAGGLYPMVGYLHERAILDHPNARSSHVTPTPRGGGLVVVPAIAGGWIAATAAGMPGPALFDVVLVAGAAVGLGAVSWLDDLRGLPAAARLLAHAAAVGVVLAATFGNDLLFGGALPPLLDKAVVAVAWVWFINLFNFMDGIDGISAAETIVIGGGTILLAVVHPNIGGLLPLAVVLIAATAGFLPWNWHPARLFLGDVGSAPLGFLLGWLLLSLAFAGQWAAAAILPAYYLADATVTLVRRALRGEKVWRAHREHFYQRAAAAGLGHRRTASLVFVLSLIHI